jgi:hypothetical protein
MDWNYGYGIEGENKSHYYAKTADYLQVPCYFKPAGNQSLVQNEPNNKIYETYLVHFMIGTNIKVNDQIKKDDILYKLQVPRVIRNHHIEVLVVREESL